MSSTPVTQGRDDALDLFKQRPRSETVRECRQAMVRLYRERVERCGSGNALAIGAYVTGDDAVSWLRAHYQGDPRLAGAVFRLKSGWQYLGMVPSIDRICHGRRKSAWIWEGGTL